MTTTPTIIMMGTIMDTIIVMVTFIIISFLPTIISTRMMTDDIEEVILYLDTIIIERIDTIESMTGTEYTATENQTKWLMDTIMTKDTTQIDTETTLE